MTTPQEISLMQTIRAKWGATIHTAVIGAVLPEWFLAALVAGESGGGENAKRFEGRVLAELWEVLMRRRPKFGSIDFGALTAQLPAGNVAGSMLKLDSLATSWGLTQIMGYESMALPGVTLATLATPTGNLQAAMVMLHQFSEEFGLNPAADFEKLFDCWNSGRPHAPTADPDYIPNAMARMELYRGLLEEPPHAVSA